MREVEDRVAGLVAAGGFSVALSGGGHRATLAAIGTLLALVDRGLNCKVLQIASISGGSITNAFVAQRCDYNALGPGQLDALAAELANKVVDKGVLTWPWITGVLGICLVITVGVTHVLLSLGLGTLGAIMSTILGVLAGAGPLFASGILVEWLLDARYFRTGSAKQRHRRRACIASIAGRRIDHVFGTTDLVVGLPVFVSNQGGGTACRWLELPPAEEFVRKVPLMHMFSARSWSIAEVVRASACFPGIAPRRVRTPRHPSINPPRLAFLVDGGIWNNLGTQVLREASWEAHPRNTKARQWRAVLSGTKPGISSGGTGEGPKNQNVRQAKTSGFR